MRLKKLIEAEQNKVEEEDSDSDEHDAMARLRKAAARI